MSFRGAQACPRCHFEGAKRLRNLVNIGTGIDMASRFLTPLTRGFGMTKSKGFKESRSQGVKWFSWYLFFKTKRGKESEKRRIRRIKGFKESRIQKSKGFKESRSQGVK